MYRRLLGVRLSIQVRKIQDLCTLKYSEAKTEAHREALGKLLLPLFLAIVHAGLGAKVLMTIMMTGDTHPSKQFGYGYRWAI